MKSAWIRWVFKIFFFPLIFLWFKSLRWPGCNIRLQKSSILIFWHCHIFSVIAYLTRFNEPKHISALVSGSEDGRLLQALLRYFSFNIIEGSSSIGGYESLLQLRRKSKQGGIVLITPDGPRGPAGQLKPGAIYLARISGNPLICADVQYENFWQLKSWDRARIPKPFSNCRIFFSEPQFVAPDLNEPELTSLNQNIETHLNGHQTFSGMETIGCQKSFVRFPFTIVGAFRNLCRSA
jgi:hypothetical protein